MKISPEMIASSARHTFAKAFFHAIFLVAALSACTGLQRQRSAP